MYVSNDMTPKSTNVQLLETDSGAESGKQSSLHGPSSLATGLGGSRSLHNTRPRCRNLRASPGIAFELGD